jgi:hypothetical protein
VRKQKLSRRGNRIQLSQNEMAKCSVLPQLSLRETLL